MTQDASDRLLKLAEVAERLGVHIDTLRTWIRDGEVPAIRLPGNAGYRIRQHDLENWLKAREHPHPTKPAASEPQE